MHVHRLSMVMAMNVRQGYKGHKRSRVRRRPASPRFPLPPLLAAGLMAGYVLGCCFGANASLPDPSDPVLSFLQSGGAGDTLYGGRFFALRLCACICALLCCGRAARTVSRAGAVSARRTLRADVRAPDGAAARSAASRCDRALFPGACAGVLPAARGSCHGELCSAVFHEAYSVTCGHSG